MSSSSDQGQPRVSTWKTNIEQRFYSCAYNKIKIYYFVLTIESMYKQEPVFQMRGIEPILCYVAF